MLDSLHIENFRCFNNFDITFDKQLTVLVGANGAGKTTLLDALPPLLKPLLGNLIKDGHYFEHNLNNYDLSLKSLTNNITFIYTINSLINQLFSINYDKQLALSNELTVNKNTFSLNNDSPYKNLLDAIAQLDDGLPIFIYYKADRQIDYSSQSNYNDQNNFIHSSFTPKIDFNASLKWFEELDAVEARTRSNTKNFDYRIPELTYARQAISKSLDDGHVYEYPHMKGIPPQLYVNNKLDGLSYSLNQLSNGYKNVLALVLDLARRMITVNGDLFRNRGLSPLESKAIVLIDDIEIHLHPSWQQTILPSLMDIFPNTQFIVTTHSPQVLTSIRNQHIRLLLNGQVFQPTNDSYGAESWRVLEHILNVSSRPKNEVSDIIDKYLDLINAGQGKSEEGQKLREQLEEWIPNDPILTDMDYFINLNEVMVDTK